eukprot:jgi/Botrbrau1/3910/Bobra.0183s0131.1
MLAKLLEPYHLKIFFSNRLIKAEVLNKLKNDVVASACTNNRWIVAHLKELGGPYASKNDERAAQVAGEYLAKKCLEKEVTGVHWDGAINQKNKTKDHSPKAEHFWRALNSAGLAGTRAPPKAPKKKLGPKPQPAAVKGDWHPQALPGPDVEAPHPEGRDSHVGHLPRNAERLFRLLPLLRPALPLSWWKWADPAYTLVVMATISTIGRPACHCYC